MPQPTHHFRPSFGPFLKTGIETGKGYVFDVRSQTAAPRLGYNASALFGVLHHAASWNEFDSPLATTNSQRFGSAQAVRDYIESEIFAQFGDQVTRISERNQASIDRLSKQFESIIEAPHAHDLKARFQLPSADLHRQFAAALGVQSILADQPPEDGPNGNSPFTFQFNLAWTIEHLDDFWNRVEACLQSLGNDPISPRVLDVYPPTSLGQNYEFHGQLLQLKSAASHSAASLAPRQPPRKLDVEKWFESQVDDPALKLLILDPETYPHFRSRILDLQSVIYEPARHSPPSEFDSVFASPNPLGLIVLRQDEIVAMSFAGPLPLFQVERGVPTDPYLKVPGTYYSMDLTVRPEFRGGMGRIIKRAISTLAIQSGVQAIHGRNRDGLARGMWAINLSMGAYEIQHLVDDYPDDHSNRDCIYYRSPLHWEHGNPKLPPESKLPPKPKTPSSSKLQEAMAALVNSVDRPSKANP